MSSLITWIRNRLICYKQRSLYLLLVRHRSKINEVYRDYGYPHDDKDNLLDGKKFADILSSSGPIIQNYHGRNLGNMRVAL